MKPDQRTLPDGRVINQRAFFNTPTSRAFFQTDLYSMFFGTTINDEIEKKLFGNIDTRGSLAVRAFCSDDKTKWQEHFQDLFEYIDAQKLRTPKGLGWLKAQYPGLSQNELMVEMQGLRTMNCTIWIEGVREIVSAEDAGIKFIVSDHPVTVFNRAASPDSTRWQQRNEPSIILKGSQTIFPLSRDFCLILTNLEYAENGSVDPAEKRTFARNFRQSMVRTDSFIRERKLSDTEVASINYILKRCAKRYIAAGRKEWLEPEASISGTWEQIGAVLRPPSDKLFGFGGELFAKFDNGHVHYQDAFGRTEKPRVFLQKEIKSGLNPRDYCGCGSGIRYRDCCEGIPIALRPSWSEKSILERNMMLFNAIINILELDGEKDWLQIRQELTDDKISKVYSLYEGLWPRETDILSLLPKPDGRARAVYTGYIHPQAILHHALGSALYFGEILLQHPFMHPGSVKKDFSPVENPHKFRHEFLKSLLLFFQTMPLVEQRLINLVPDPCEFDPHLRDQMMAMAQTRLGFIDPKLSKEPLIEQIIREDARRVMLSRPEDALRRMLSRGEAERDRVDTDQLLRAVKSMRENDPLSSLQPGDFEAGDGDGQFTFFKLAPNFEMSMYLAQATGASIITDSKFRWQEIQLAILRQSYGADDVARGLKENIEASQFAFVHHPESVGALIHDQAVLRYADLMKSTFRYLSALAQKARKPNFEAGLGSRFTTTHSQLQTIVRNSGHAWTAAKMNAALPEGGIRDNTVNRLLLMSNSEHHLRSVPMAFYFRSSGQRPT
ncbi:DUF4238 domain-containing protein [Hoeflea sp.]|uniref:DUF4238 domain-containing protein n=1 Tax=Hoeflea sp. TaxID=1940281 RepID=UPI00374A5630